MTSDLLHHPNRRHIDTSWFFSRCTKQQGRQQHAYLPVSSIKWSILWHGPGARWNAAPPPRPSPDKSSTAIQIGSLDSLRLQAASSYRPTWLWGAGRRGSVIWPTELFEGRFSTLMQSSTHIYKAELKRSDPSFSNVNIYRIPTSLKILNSIFLYCGLLNGQNRPFQIVNFSFG